MENLPFVSIIVPAYNAERIIQGCIEALLNQDYPKDRYETIVVDNNSRDKTAQIVKKYPVSYVEEKAIQGAYAARNRGINQAKGQILAFIDADCVASREWIKKGVDSFTEDTVGCIAGGIKGYRPRNYVEEYLCERNMITQEEKTVDLPFPYAKTANAFYKKLIFDKIGFFEEKWISGGDADLSWRMQLETKYKIKFVPEAHVFHKHRSTILSMFMQCINWGIGYTLLYKKYQREMQKRTIKQTLWVLQRLIYILIKAVIFCFYKKETMPKEKREKYLDLISFMGWEIGRIMGSIKNGVLAI
jgi:cellulose synthase/poly-beta-1,6-N-acetylglucosamine synthase-like glycosyltransferase